MDEHTPLLTPISSLPKRQLAILCAVRLVDPLTFTQIFPYINQFLSRLHLVKNRSQIGFYSGLVVSFDVPLLIGAYSCYMLRNPPLRFSNFAVYITGRGFLTTLAADQSFLLARLV